MPKPADPLGDRMKAHYENRTRFYLPRRTYTILRIDGKAFHTFTRKLARPFDDWLTETMDAAAHGLCKEAMGCRLAYGQSDEYSFLLTDFETTLSEAWFDGNIQKICSVAASIFTAAFNSKPYFASKQATFDCRVFTIPDPIEVENYIIWRQQDAVRNSIQSVGQANFSQKELHGLNCSQIQEKLFQEKGINWNNTPTHYKRGRCVIKKAELIDGVVHTAWTVDRQIPTFTSDRDYLISRIPQLEVRPVAAAAAAAAAA
jgi:tRNA(His) 5'-end guanylyltransferase